MEPDETSDEGRARWLPPEDRLWRHPSEMAAHGTGRSSLPPEPPRGAAWRRHRPFFSRPAGFALVAGATGIAFAGGFLLATGIGAGHKVIEQIKTPASNNALTVDNGANAVGSWPQIADQLSASVVAVQSANNQTGSGLLYASAKGQSFIITTGDVMMNAASATVTFDDGTSSRASVVGIDQQADVAVLSVQGAHDALPSFGTVATASAADPVMTLTAPAGGNVSTSTGTIASMDQTVTESNGSTVENLLAIGGIDVQSGMSGSPVIGQSGAVLGITADLPVSGDTDQGTSWAVPVDVAERVASQMIRGQRATNPWIGLDSASDISSLTAHQLDLSGGARVDSVAAASPAAVAGLQPNDIVVDFGGQLVTSTGTFVALLNQATPGTRLNMTVLHNGHREHLVVAVRNAPAAGG